MPVYEYQCNQCGEKTQRLQGVGEDSSGERCPSCDKGVIKKIFSLFSTTQKGPAGSCGAGDSSRFT